MKKIISNNQNLGGYGEVVVAVNNDVNSRKLADRVAALNKGGRNIMAYDTIAFVSTLGGALYVSNNTYGVMTFCKDPEVIEKVAKMKDAIGTFSKVIDRNDSIITFELTVFYDLTVEDILKNATPAKF